jgi:hypothetical protein
MYDIPGHGPKYGMNAAECPFANVSSLPIVVEAAPNRSASDGGE